MGLIEELQRFRVIDAHAHTTAVFHPSPGMPVVKIVVPGNGKTGNRITNRWCQ